MLGELIKFTGNGITHGKGLASGLNPEDVNAVTARTKKVLTRAGKMPMKATAQKIINTAKVASFMETQNNLINQQIEQQERQLTAALNNRDAAIKFAATRMKAEQRFQQQGATLQDLMLQHRLATGVIQAESVGTQQAYTKQSIIDLL